MLLDGALLIRDHISGVKRVQKVLVDVVILVVKRVRFQNNWCVEVGSICVFLGVSGNYSLVSPMTPLLDLCFDQDVLWKAFDVLNL